MSRYDLLAALGDVDEESVGKAKEKKRSKRAVRIALAACILLALMIPVAMGVAHLFDGRMSEGNASPTGPSVLPKYKEPLYFEGYDALISAVDNGFSGRLDRDALGQYPPAEKAFEHFEEALRKDGVPVPLLGGERLELRSEEGFSGITLFPSELYELPWIFYHPFVATGENFYIQLTVIPETVSDAQKSGSASELIRALSPNSANTDNYHESSVLKNVYESEVVLEDRRVTALNYEYINDARECTIFIYDDLLIMVRADTEVWSSQWFSQLSFER